MTFDFVCEREFDMGSIRHPAEFLPLLKNYANSPQETLLCITMNATHKPIKCHIVSVGTVNNTMVHPRDIFRDAILENAAAIVISHNHPSGNTEPSEPDVKMTEIVKKASELMGIHLLDHIIFSPYGEYYSFVEHDLL